ncbi:DUF2254 domain-containing protein [Peteryoungia desertarenae]|uniref:DUF2254 domain-containing protein n=1 Tax=Peteryoungia desertarenae TaxID=1813451 RepID=A0ABX6QMP9_9HYPH|nr:DUF2254 domain-containing protein [Peteryoungia desertarenae]QLF69586.1 DUF2254 domain-containing protein [Peteryoungia desertarenae]
MSRRWWLLVQITKRLWFRATLYTLIAIATALLGVGFGHYIPDSLSDMVGADAVDPILTIIASSMLAVTTFSLSTLVSATSTAANGGTPRAIGLVLEDQTAQSALSTFLGAFLFSLVSLIALNTGLYGGGGRVVLFVVTLIVVALIVTMLLRWIDHLAGLGQVSETISRVTEATEQALQSLADNPCLGCSPYDTPPPLAMPLFPDETGYVRHLDTSILAEWAEKLQAHVYVAKRPGEFCSRAEPILHVVLPNGFGDDTDEAEHHLRRAFTIGANRSYDQDPLFGLTVLSEIASRALSSGINDPGTAVDVISQQARILSRAADRSAARQKDMKPTTSNTGRGPKPHRRVHAAPIEPLSLLETSFLTVARDAAGMVEVAIAQQRALAALSASRDKDYAAAARSLAKVVLDRALSKLEFEDDKARVETEHRKVLNA